jgi:mannose-6-phosphate isomerase-like protein (cupin superfamily)
VLKGALDIELRDRTVILNSGEIFVVPKGVEHRPVARAEVHILLIEPTDTPSTGDKRRRAFSLDRSLHYRAYWHFSDVVGLTDDVGS